MTPEAGKRIVITREELRDGAIDDVLEQQLSYTPPQQESAPAPKRRLIYSAWFYLMLAGGVGGFLGWALMEPQFADGVMFMGRIEKIEPDVVLPTPAPMPVELRGRLTISGITVYIAPEITRIGSGSTKSRLSIRELNEGAVVRVQGAAPTDTIMLADAIRVENPNTSVPSLIGLSSLRMQAQIFGFLLLPVVAAFIGLLVGAVEGIVCRTYARAAWCGAIGLVCGLVGGCISTFGAGIIFSLLGTLVSGDPTQSAGLFLFHMFRRGLAWTIAGMAMGLGQGFALKSSKLKLNGFIGGMVGALVGGLLFDPINLLITGRDPFAGAELSRAIGLTAIGLAVGLLIGLTDLLTRDAWLKVLEGPLQGKEFSFDRTPIRIGSSPKNEIYLFKDPDVEPLHAQINKMRDTFEIEDTSGSAGTLVNGQRITRHRLKDGDRIRVGKSEFAYSAREKKSA